MKKRNNKLAIIAIAAVLVVGVIAGTFAYFAQSATFDNVFTTKPYSVEAYESFDSPDNWVPGTTTDKEIFATNKGDVATVVRLSFTQEWVSANGNPLNLQIKNSEDEDEDVAIINFTENSNWVKDGNYYYYNAILAKDQSTDSFIDSVTFNEIAKNDSVAVDGSGKAYGEEGYDATAWDENGNYIGWKDEDGLTHKTYASTGDGYDGATYTLSITVEFLQASSDAMISVWNVSNAEGATGAAADLLAAVKATETTDTTTTGE